jgi:hypothetical protein
VLLARLAEMNMKIDEAGRDDKVVGVELFVVFALDAARFGDGRNATLAKEQVHEAVNVVGGIDDVPATDQHGG